MSSLTDMMQTVSGPMHSPIAESRELPPPVSTSGSGGIPEHERIQHVMNGAADTQPRRTRNAKGVELNADVKDGIVVAAMAVIILMPNVQAMLSSKLSMMQSPTNATVINALLIAACYYMAREHVVGML